MIGKLAPLAAVFCLSQAVLANEIRQKAEESNRLPVIGRTITDFVLSDFRGKQHSLSSLADKPVVVVYFFGTDCPLAKHYSLRLGRMSAEYADKGVAFMGINSNVQDSLAEIENHVRVHNVEFPALKDVGNLVADQFGATRTPEVFVLDANRKIRYQGRVDAQYTFGSGVGLAAPAEKRADLQIALDELLAGNDVSVPTTEAKGCIIGRVRPQQSDSDITYSNQIARIFQQRCLECHREGQIAPFAMTNYSEVAGWGEMIAEVVDQQRMPPWHADPAFGHFQNDSRLSDLEKEQVLAWVDKGCPEGNPADLPEPIQYNDTWQLPGGPDEIFYMSEEPVLVKAEGSEPYRYYVVDPGFKEDKWVRLAEALPGNRAVVHHIIVFIQPPGRAVRDHGETRLLVGYAPGTRPGAYGDGWAKKIPAGSKLVFQMHYTPIGSEQTDRSMLGLVYIDESEVTHQVVTTNAIRMDFVIPPNAKDHQVVSTREHTRDGYLLSMFPHMHIRGSAFKYELVTPDGQSQTLLNVPMYDFNWQNHYTLAEPMFIPKGSKMVCTAWYDNTADNLANPDPNVSVRWGDQTWEEMMIGWHDIAYPRQSGESEQPGG
ncbi:MAG: redoxin domain-containing protein [Pirellulaceae bacterium]|nr:redoxin domain-containing protein [Pirellulaceae bacterium]